MKYIKKPKPIGKRYELTCGVVVTLLEWVDNVTIRIADDEGNTKWTNSSQLYRGQVSWAEFGVVTPTKVHKRWPVGARALSKRHGYYEVVEVNNCDEIRIVWDDYEVSQICSVYQLDDNSVRPKSNSHLAYLDEIKGYYVYTVMGKCGEIVYIGKGVGRRLLHANSGTSHNYYLNEMHFAKLISSVDVYQDNLTEDAALLLEKALIKKYSPKCNIILNPNVSFQNEVIS